MGEKGQEKGMKWRDPGFKISIFNAYSFIILMVKLVHR